MIVRNKIAFYNHLSKMHEIKFSCDLCGKTFKQKPELIDHMYTYHMNVKFSCNLCSAEFRSSLKVGTHKRFAHNKKYKCDKCDAAYSVPSHLADHVRVKHEKKRYYCTFPGCSKTLSSRSNAKKHLHIAHSSEPEVVEKSVDICKNINKNKTLEFSCDLCGKVCSKKQHLIDHMHTYHINIKYNCNVCSAEFRSNEKLKKHERRVHNKKFKCGECTADFGESYLLVEHIKVKHEGERFHCRYSGCSLTFLSKSTETAHFLRTHTLAGEKIKKYYENIQML